MAEHYIDRDSLPNRYPTHHMPPEFWEELGRAVATFGFLEETLGRAIFALSGTRPYPTEAEATATYPQWINLLEQALYDSLGGLINIYVKEAREHSNFPLTLLEELVEDLRKAAVVRNVICHGSWRMPDAEGKSLPLFVNRKCEVWDVPIGVDYLKQLQTHAAELTNRVVDTITLMGLNFPGADGPGKPIW